MIVVAAYAFKCSLSKSAIACEIRVPAVMYSAQSVISSQ